MESRVKHLGLALLLAVGGIGASARAANSLSLCIYDPMGTRGDAYGYAKDYVLQMPKFGITTPVQLKAYTNEAVAAADFKAGICDGLAISSIRAKQFNNFTGSLDAIGAVKDTKQLNLVLQTLARPEMAKNMVQGQYEVVGIIPLGAAYFMVRDRNLNTLAKAAGKKVAVFDYDKTQAQLVQRVGAQPVSVDLSTLPGKFNNGQVDIMAGPAVLFRPLELSKGMTGSNGQVTGAIVRFPLVQVTATMLVNRNKFNNEAANQKIREYVVGQLGRAYDYVGKEERAIAPKYWMDVPATEQPGYSKLMREARIDLAKQGYYDKRMLSLLKKVRCKFEPASYECSLSDE